MKRTLLSLSALFLVAACSDRPEPRPQEAPSAAEATPAPAPAPANSDATPEDAIICTLTGIDWDDESDRVRFEYCIENSTDIALRPSGFLVAALVRDPVLIDDRGARWRL